MFLFLWPLRASLWLLLLVAPATRARKLEDHEYKEWVRQLNSCTASVEVVGIKAYVWRLPEHLSPAGLILLLTLTPSVGTFWAVHKSCP